MKIVKVFFIAVVVIYILVNSTNEIPYTNKLRSRVSWGNHRHQQRYVPWEVVIFPVPDKNGVAILSKHSIYQTRLSVFCLSINVI